MRSRRTYLAWILITLFLLLGHYSGLSAQEPGQWSMRQRIPGSHDRVQTPYLAADQNGTIHAFHSQPVGENESLVDIVYSRWNLEQGWTEPVDVLLSPFRGKAEVKGVFLDQTGRLHLIFFGGDDVAAAIYYSWVQAIDAGRAPAWSTPMLIGKTALTPAEAALIGDEEGNLLVVYSGNIDDKAIYAVNSSDAGNTWSEPIPISWSYRVDQHLWALQLYRDARKNLHAVWTVNNERGVGYSIEYIRSENGFDHWSLPVELALFNEERGYEVDWPAIVSHEGRMFLIYNDFHPPKRMMRVSADEGRIWSEPVEVFAPTRGEYGAATFAVDSGNTLHVIFGDRGRTRNLWHSVWRENTWQAPQPLVPDAELALIRPGHPLTFHPQRPRAVISQGNVLFVVWRQDWGDVQNGSWYSYLMLDTPELEHVPLPTAFYPTPTPLPLPKVATLDVVSEVSTPVATPRLEFDMAFAEPQLSQPNRILLMSLIPSILGIISVIAIYRWHQRNL